MLWLIPASLLLAVFVIGAGVASRADWILGMFCGVIICLAGDIAADLWRDRRFR